MQVTQEYHKMLKVFRKSANLTQEDIAYELNITQSSVSKLESGRKLIDIQTFMNWVSVTNSEIHAASLIFGNEVINSTGGIVCDLTQIYFEIDRVKAKDYSYR